MAKRRTISRQLEKRLYQESGSACCICGEQDVKALEIHHIQGDPSVHEESDMLVLCASCHAKAERDGFSQSQLYEAKMAPKKQPASLDDNPLPAIQVPGSSNVIAGRDVNIQTLSIRTSKSNLRAPVMPGTVAEHPYQANYLEYLVSRYNEFKKWDCEKSGKLMKYPLIRVAYAREIGCKVKDTPIEQFERACTYLQQRIDGSKLGRINRSHGSPNYSDYEDWLSDKGLVK